MIRLIIVGLIAGWLAGKLMHGKGYGLFADICLGLIGAVVGGWIFGAFGLVSYGTLGLLTTATVGAVALVGAAHALRGAF